MTTTITGTAGDDKFVVPVGDAEIQGLAGNDEFVLDLAAALGHLTLDGGAGVDLVSLPLIRRLNDDPIAVTINLATGEVSSLDRGVAHSFSITLRGIESLSALPGDWASRSKLSKSLPGPASTTAPPSSVSSPAPPIKVGILNSEMVLASR